MKRDLVVVNDIDHDVYYINPDHVSCIRHDTEDSRYYEVFFDVRAKSVRLVKEDLDKLLRHFLVFNYAKHFKKEGE